MEKAVTSVNSGMVTNAVRDTSLGGRKIRAGDLLGIAEGKIVVNGDDMELVIKELVRHLKNNNTEIITIYYGEDVKESDAQAIAGIIEENYGDHDVELVYGGQPVYKYLVSVE